MNIGNIIHSKRLERGLNITELAKKVNVSHTTVLRWERGDISTVKTSKIKELADTLGISPLDLLGSPTEAELTFVEKYRQLSTKDKDEILALIDFKLSRRQSNEHQP